MCRDPLDVFLSKSTLHSVRGVYRDGRHEVTVFGQSGLRGTGYGASFEEASANALNAIFVAQMSAASAYTAVPYEAGQVVRRMG